MARLLKRCAADKNEARIFRKLKLHFRWGANDEKVVRPQGFSVHQAGSRDQKDAEFQLLKIQNVFPFAHGDRSHGRKSDMRIRANVEPI